MKKRGIKILNHVFVWSTLALFSCSKTDNATSVKPPVADSFAPQTTGVTARKMSAQTGNMTDYLLYIPDGYNEKKDYKWPVVFFLHGIAEIGNNVNVLKNVGLVKVAAGKPFVIVAPQCGKDWWNIAALETFYKEVMSKYHVDPNRVYLTGLSMGGYGTWDWGTEHPERFAALIPICGAGSKSQMPKLKTMPIWVFHCADDPTVNVSNSRTLVDALKAIGSNVQYTEYPSGGHDAWTRTYANADVYTWLLKQHK